MTAGAQPLRPRAGSGPLGGPLVSVRSTTSTNDLARTLAQSGAPGGTVVSAEEQTAGRGRQGRTWVAPPGRALTVSAIVRWKPPRETVGWSRALPDHPPGEAPPAFELLPLVAALAVAEACEQASGGACEIKWPNDIWIAGRKAAGILIEARPREGWAVLGIGMNVDTAAAELAPDLRETATSLRIATGAPVDRGRVLTALLERLADRIAAWREGAHDSLLDRYRERDALAGRQIAWTAQAGRCEGRAEGVDERGNLVVRTDCGEQVTLEAGEVHLLR